MKGIYSFIAILAVGLFITSCNSSDSTKNDSTTSNTATTSHNDGKDTVNKGIGKFTKVELTHPLDATMITKGEAIFNSKCIACHKLTTEKLVGPGWKGITDRRSAEWIMNFSVNTNVMLDSDLVAQQLLVTCVARMPNQNLNDEDARNVLEFMRKNDGKN